MDFVLGYEWFSSHQTQLSVNDFGEDKECFRVVFIIFLIGGAKDLFLVLPVDFNLKTSVSDVSKKKFYLIQIVVRTFYSCQHHDFLCY